MLKFKNLGYIYWGLEKINTNLIKNCTKEFCNMKTKTQTKTNIIKECWRMLKESWSNQEKKYKFKSW
jgi:hypothetical protein